MVVHKKAQRGALVQTGLRLEAEILDRLRSGGRGLSDEIRERLERTFKEDAIDPVTRELRGGLLTIAARLRADYGAEWHASWYAHQAFTAAIKQRLAGYEPPEPPPSAAVADLFEPPDTVGRLRERDDQRAQSYPHLEGAQKRHSTRRMARAARHMKATRENDHE
jgi:hypothetical protein